MVVNIKAGCSILIDHTDSVIMTINYFLFNYRDSAISRNFHTIHSFGHIILVGLDQGHKKSAVLAH